MVQQQNPVFRKCIQELETESVRVSDLTSPPVLPAGASLMNSDRVRFDESQYRTPVFRRGRDGHTPQSRSLRSSFSPSTSVSGQHIMVPAVAASSGHVDRDHLDSTLGNLADVIDNQTLC